MITEIKEETIKRLLIDTPFSNSFISRVNEGVSTDVFKLVGKQGVSYLRILPFDELSLPQVTAHKLLLDKKILVPQILLSKDNCEDINNRSYMIVSEIHGNSLFNTLGEISESQIKEILFNAGKDLTKINDVPVSKFGPIIDVENKSFIGLSNDYKEINITSATLAIKYLVERGAMTVKTSEKILNILEKNKKIFEIQLSWLNHGDFDLSHIYQKDGVYSGLIDFGDIRGGSKYQDLAHYKIFSNVYFDSLLEGYMSVFLPENDYRNNITVEALICAVNILKSGIEKDREILIVKAKEFLATVV